MAAGPALTPGGRMRYNGGTMTSIPASTMRVALLLLAALLSACAAGTPPPAATVAPLPSTVPESGLPLPLGGNAIRRDLGDVASAARAIIDIDVRVPLRRKAIRDHGHKAVHFAGKAADAAAEVAPRLRPGDIFLTMGAGDVWKLGESILSG